MTKQPFVSVLVPSYNYARYLPEALDSLLNQTYASFEVIVWDDGSTDESCSILKSYADRHPGKIRFFQHSERKNKGIAETYRCALNQARGELIAFLEADDLWCAENLSKKVQAFQLCPQAGVVYSAYEPFGKGISVFYWKIHGWINQCGIPREQPFNMLNHLLRRDPVASFSHFVVRRELLEKVPKLNFMHRFYDWWVLAHVSCETKFYFIPQKLSQWRIHSQSAGYGKVTRKTLFRLQGFLRRLVRSLKELNRVTDENLNADRYSMLRRHGDFYQIIQNKKKSAFFLKLIKHPFETIRFVGYVVLKNAFFSECDLKRG